MKNERGIVGAGTHHVRTNGSAKVVLGIHLLLTVLVVQEIAGLALPLGRGNAFVVDPDLGFGRTAKTLSFGSCCPHVTSSSRKGWGCEERSREVEEETKTTTTTAEALKRVEFEERAG